MSRWSAWTDNHGVGLINVSAWPYTLTADKTYAWKVRLCIVDKKDKIQKIARRVLPKL